MFHPHNEKSKCKAYHQIGDKILSNWVRGLLYTTLEVLDWKKCGNNYCDEQKLSLKNLINTLNIVFLFLAPNHVLFHLCTSMGKGAHTSNSQMHTHTLTLQHNKALVGVLYFNQPINLEQSRTKHLAFANRAATFQ